MTLLNSLRLLFILIDAAALILFFIGRLSFPYFCLIHLLNCLVFLKTFFSLSVLKTNGESEKRSMLILYFFLALLIPSLGMVAILFLKEWLKTALKRYQRIIIKSMRIHTVFQPLRVKYGIGGLHLRLQSSRLPSHDKMKALQEAITLSPDKVNQSVRTLLSDNNDEVRLLAFQVLSMQEKKIIPKITQSLRQLTTETNERKKWLLEKNLAFEYWELIYRGLVEPNLTSFVAQKSLNHALNALQKAPLDTALLYLAGRLSLMQKNVAPAKAFFMRYLEAKGFKERIISFLIEIAYIEKDYAAIKQALAIASPIPTIYISQAYYDFWNARHD